MNDELELLIQEATLEMPTIQEELLAESIIIDEDTIIEDGEEVIIDSIALPMEFAERNGAIVDITTDLREAFINSTALIGPDTSSYVEVAIINTTILPTPEVLTTSPSVITMSSSDDTLKLWDMEAKHTETGHGVSEEEIVTLDIENSQSTEAVITLDEMAGYFNANSKHATQVSITAYNEDGEALFNEQSYRNGNNTNVMTITCDEVISKIEISMTGMDGNFVIQKVELNNIDEATWY